MSTEEQTKRGALLNFISHDAFLCRTQRTTSQETPEQENNCVNTKNKAIISMMDHLSYTKQENSHLLFVSIIKYKQKYR